MGKKNIKSNVGIYNTDEFSNWHDRDWLTREEKTLFDLLPPDRGLKIIDIGTGNGRFLFKLAEKGFTDLHGIDLSENLLSVAIKKAEKLFPFVKFYKMNAAKLDFGSDSFDVVIALQQVISLIDSENERIKALKECYRICKRKGLFIASFLHYEGRNYNPMLSMMTLPIKFIKKEKNFLSKSYLPWLTLGNRPNIMYLWQKQPYTYWFKTSEIKKLIEDVGFNILEIKTTKMIQENKKEFKPGGMIYFVCTK